MCSEKLIIKTNGYDRSKNKKTYSQIFLLKDFSDLVLKMCFFPNLRYLRLLDRVGEEYGPEHLVAHDRCFLLVLVPLTISKKQNVLVTNHL